MLTNEELKLAKQRYKQHNGDCRNRIDKSGNPIKMKLTFEQWLDIWLQSGHWHERGRCKGQYVMSRKDDTGHYEIGNIEIKTVAENNRENTKSEQFLKKNIAILEKRNNDPAFKAKRKSAIQKAQNKPISCDGVIYESKITAALTLSPKTRLTNGSKDAWFNNQMKKYPERYFYI